MRRKRFQHIANTLCRMFCGWRQIFSKPQLVELGSGRLEVDVLHERCLFNGSSVDPLPVLADLRGWLLRDLNQASIPLDALDAVRVTVGLEFTVVAWEERTGHDQFFVKGVEIRGGLLHRCQVGCESLVKSGAAEYRGYLHDSEDWPVGWPAA